jgi:hypothetical protein
LDKQGAERQLLNFLNNSYTIGGAEKNTPKFSGVFTKNNQKNLP